MAIYDTALLSDAILDYHDVITRQTRVRRFVKLRTDASFILFGIKCRALEGSVVFSIEAVISGFVIDPAKAVTIIFDAIIEYRTCGIS